MCETRRATKPCRKSKGWLSSVAVVEEKVKENECEEDKDSAKGTANNNSQRKKKDLLACNIVLDSSAIKRWP